MSTLTVTIGGSPVTILENTLTITSRLDDKDKCQFTVLDSTGALIFQHGQTVKVADSSFGTLFTGFIDKPTAVNLWPSPAQEWSIDCVNKFYVPAKKTHKRKHKGQHAAPIVALQIQQYLEPSGVAGNFGLDWTELQSDWQGGTLSGTTAATNLTTGNVGAGNLELAPSGASLTHAEQTTSDFSAGTLSSVMASNNNLTLNGRQGIAVSASCTGQGGSNNYLYYKIWSGSYSIVSGDSLQYNVWISAACPEIKCAVDGTCTDGTTIKNFSGSSLVDQNGFQATPKTNLKGWADSQWYFRQIDISGLAGKTLNTAQIGIEGDTTGAYAAYFYTIIIKNGGSTKLTIYNGGALNTSSQISNVGYSNFAISTPTVYDRSGYRISPTTSIASIGAVANSAVQYTSNVPDGTSLLVNSSFDGGATWQAATSMSSISGLFVGDNTANLSMATQQILNLTGNDPTITPSISAISWTVTPALSTTKTDVIATYNSSGAFNTGTYSNTQLVTSQATNTPIFMQYGATQAVTLNGAWRNWQDESLSGQTLFGPVSPGQSASQGQLILAVPTPGIDNDARSQFNFAGQWQNFVASIDVQIPGTLNSEHVGMIYRTTNWNNANNSFAYVVEITQQWIKLGYGTNTGSTDVYTNIATVNFTTPLSAGDWHTITIAVNGTSHTVSIDGINYVNALADATYNFAGYLGARDYNNAGGGGSYHTKAFGVVAALQGTWTTPNINLNGVGIVGSSIVQWDQATLPAGTSIAAQTSIDGGTTWQAVGNGGAIAQLPAGSNVAGVNLLVQFILTSGSAITSPALNSVTVLVSSQYSASGNRINAPLAADTAYRLNVGSGFGTSATGMTYTQVGTGTINLTGNELQISNTTGSVHMVAGSATGTDEDGTFRFSLSASTISAGMDLRYTSINNYYQFKASTTTLTLIKKSASLSITLATASMALTAGTFYKLRFRVVGNSPVNLYGRVWLDGTAEPATWNIVATD